MTDWSYAHGKDFSVRHGLGHYVGMSVHDSGSYREKFAPGMMQGPDRRSFEVVTSPLNESSDEFNKVARRHAMRFVKENSAIGIEAGRDVSALARTTYVTLAKRTAAPQKARKAPGSRKRAARKAV